MSEKYQCTCPNGSYAIKHSTGCYEARIYELQAEVERLKLSREHDYCEYTALTDKCAGLEIERDRLKSCQVDMQRWKLMAEYQYALRAYPDELSLGSGALDATMLKWTGEEYKSVIDAWHKSQPQPTEGKPT